MLKIGDKVYTTEEIREAAEAAVAVGSGSADKAYFMSVAAEEHGFEDLSKDLYKLHHVIYELAHMVDQLLS